MAPYRIRVASLSDGTLREINGAAVLQVPAPVRHFHEMPGLMIQDDLVGIASGRQCGSEWNRIRAVEVVLVNHVKGVVQAVSSSLRRMGRILTK